MTILLRCSNADLDTSLISPNDGPEELVVYSKVTHHHVIGVAVGRCMMWAGGSGVVLNFQQQLHRAQMKERGYFDIGPSLSQVEVTQETKRVLQLSLNGERC
jgi:hypothetical protein